MPTRGTHDLLGMGAVVPVAALTVALYPPAVVPVLVGHVFGTFWLSPDLDQPAALGGEIGRRWLFLRSLWKPYELAVPHRSAWSHSGVSALVRLLYLAAHVVLWLGVASLVTGYPALWWAGLAIARVPAVLWLGFAVGCVSADVVHTSADVVSTFFRRRF